MEQAPRLAHALLSAAGRWRYIGELLNEARPLCGHGRWLKFVKSCGLKPRFADECMLIAERWPEIQAKWRGGANLTITGIRRMFPSSPRKALEDDTPRPLSKGQKASRDSEEGQADALAQAGGLVEDVEAEPVKPDGHDVHRPNQEHIGARLVDPDSAAAEQPDGVEIEPGDAPEQESAADGFVGMPQEPAMPGTGAGQGADPDDMRWLDSLPLHGALEDPSRFDAQALLWRAARPWIDQLRRLVAPSASQIAGASNAMTAKKNYPLRLVFASHVRPPDRWRMCPRCRGRFTDRTGTIPCPDCDGGGFVVTHEGDYDEPEEC
jgi:hypothetical protein